jgi:DNA polymerase-4
LVEPLSLDEAFLDVTKNNKNIESAIHIAEEIKEKIYQKTNLTASAGISVNKFLAKVASDMNKPNGLYLIRPEHASQFVEELPVHKFFGIGKATAKRMSSMAINTGADLKKLTQIEMVKKFGKSGLFFYEIVRGEDNRPVNPDRERKSVGVERTFENDIKDINELQLKLNDIVSELVTRINKHGFKGKTLSLKIKYFDFKTISRSTSSKHYFTEQEEIDNNAVNLLRIVENIHLGVRLLGLSVSNSDNSKKYHQLTLPF